MLHLWSVGKHVNDTGCLPIFKNHDQSLFPLRHVFCVALCALAFALLFSPSLESVILVSHQHLNGLVLSIYCSSSSIYDRRHKKKSQEQYKQLSVYSD